jgi:hypothetical protein
VDGIQIASPYPTPSWRRADAIRPTYEIDSYQMSASTHLRLIDSAAAPPEESSLGPAVGRPRPRGSARRSAPGRPSDQLTPWWAPQVQALRSIVRAATSHRVSLDIALTLVLERALAVEELSTVEPALPGLLDAQAAAARPDSALDGASALYLRQLAGGNSSAAGPSTGPQLIPVRVAARVQHADDRRVAELLGGDLALAISWERAAVLGHRTMGEWACSQALRQLSR